MVAFNQIINLIHLTALFYEYDIEIYKFSDLFIESENGSLIFKIQKMKLTGKSEINVQILNYLDFSN